MPQIYQNDQYKRFIRFAVSPLGKSGRVKRKKHNRGISECTFTSDFTSDANTQTRKDLFSISDGGQDAGDRARDLSICAEKDSVQRSSKGIDTRCNKDLKEERSNVEELKSACKPDPQSFHKDEQRSHLVVTGSPETDHPKCTDATITRKSSSSESDTGTVATENVSEGSSSSDKSYSEESVTLRRLSGDGPLNEAACYSFNLEEHPSLRGLPSSGSQSDISGNQSLPEEHLISRNPCCDDPQDVHNEIEATVSDAFVALTQKKCCPSVQFGKVEIIVFSIRIGDNPSVSRGTPIAMGEERLSSDEHSVEDFEGKLRNRRLTKRELAIDPVKRHLILRELGYSGKQIHKAEQAAAIDRERRLKCAKKYFKERNGSGDSSSDFNVRSLMQRYTPLSRSSSERSLRTV